MRASRGEITIEEILQQAGLTFEEEYSFPDLLSNNKRPLRFDFAVFDDDGDLDFLIEYQGIQHYQAKRNLAVRLAYINSKLMICVNVSIVKNMVIS